MHICSFIFYLSLCLSINPYQLFSKPPTTQQTEKVLICGVCKNIQAAVPNIIQNIEKLGQQFQDYAVIIYENNSQDQTVRLLKKWAKLNSHVNFISQKISTRKLPPTREERIARARNIVLSVAQNAQYETIA